MDLTPKRTRVRRPEVAEPVQPVATPVEAHHNPPWRPPFRAEGVKVLDKDGRVACVCTSMTAFDLRRDLARHIADALNGDLGKDLT